MKLLESKMKQFSSLTRTEKNKFDQFIALIINLFNKKKSKIYEI